jgi:undecaprenyl diphosphate synthase
MSQLTEVLPQHIAFIPDGNRRWATAHGLSAKDGHKEGYRVLRDTAERCFDRGIKYVTFYGFSTENWSRSADEVGYLMKLFAWIVKEEAKEFHQRGFKLQFLGSEEGVDPVLLKGIREVEQLTAHNNAGTLNICFNYGGRRDITDAVNRMLQRGITSIDEASFGDWLSTKGVPDPDLIIRTSGEQRLSNYLIWEGAYSELYFTDVLWPEFNGGELDKALAEYAQRQRNFGA